jgi:hypothetical protein
VAGGLGVNGLRRRVLNLSAVAGEHLPGAGPTTSKRAVIICDRCGRTDPVDLENPTAEGWGNGAEGDLCPSCMEGR